MADPLTITDFLGKLYLLDNPKELRLCRADFVAVFSRFRALTKKVEIGDGNSYSYMMIDGTKVVLWPPEKSTRPLMVDLSDDPQGWE